MPDPVLVGVIRRGGVQHPDDPALVGGSGTTTYGALDRRATQVANALAAGGVGPGDRVALLDRNGPAFFEVLFGAAMLNAVPVALNWRLSPLEIGRVLDDVDARVLIVAPEFTGHLAELVASGREMHERRVVLGPGGSAGKADQTYETWLGAHPAHADRHVSATGDDLALLVYTSGTTGQPRGVEITHDCLRFLLPRAAQAYRFGRESVNLAAMPLFHISGSGWSLACLYAGGRVAVLREADPVSLLRTIEEERVTHLALVTSVVGFLLSHPACASTDLSSLRLLAYGGSPAPPDLIEAAARTFSCDLVQLYGLTETAGPVTVLSATDHLAGRLDRLASCGVPYPWVELKITDPATGTDVRPGAVGEICVRSEQMMRGYWRRPDETADVLTPDGWLRTGDAGRVDPDGYVSVEDRVKDMIISGGENVYPAEVEQVLGAHPTVAEVAVIGVPDDRWGEVPRAVVVPAHGITAHDDLAAELMAWCRQRLAHYKCPAAVEFTTDFPRTGSGKILKRELRAPFWAGRNRRI